jgi:hypothetical protein
MIVEQLLLVEAHELAQQAMIRFIRCRGDFEVRGGKPFGQIVNTDRHLADDSEGPATAALERPEQVGIGARIGDS